MSSQSFSLYTLEMGIGSAVEQQPEPQGKKSEPHARNHKIFNRTQALIGKLIYQPHFCP